MAWSDTTTSSSSQKQYPSYSYSSSSSLAKSLSRRLLFRSSSSTNLSPSKKDGSSRTSSGSIREGGEEDGIEDHDEGVEVADGFNDDRMSSHSTMSERGTVSTDPHHADNVAAIFTAAPSPSMISSQPSVPSKPQSQVQFQVQASSKTTQDKNMNSSSNSNPNQLLKKQTRNKIKGNVQIQINGRYIPQLDMIFASSKLRTGSNADGGRYSSEPNCRFVNGNGIRPSTDTLNMLLGKGNEEQQEQQKEVQKVVSCSCHESIRNSPHHLCDQMTTTTTTVHKPQKNQQFATATSSPILTPGRNLLRYTLFSPKGNGNNTTILATAEAHLYLWSSSDSVVVSDVDGTVTKSDVRGVIDTVIQDRFEYCHSSICKFYFDIINTNTSSGEEEEGYSNGIMQRQYRNDKTTAAADNNGSGATVRFLYLSSRPVSLIGQTRKLIVSLSQTSQNKKKYGLPPGPIFHHTGPLTSVLFSELISKNIHEFKADVLARQVVLPFVAARGDDWRLRRKRGSFGGDGCKKCVCLEMGRHGAGGICEEASTAADTDDGFGTTVAFEEREDHVPERTFSTQSGISEVSTTVWDDRLFLAGFGNKITDAMAYEMAGIDRRDIYIIDKESRILNMGSGGDGGSVNSSSREQSSFERNPSTCNVPPTASISSTSGMIAEQSEWSIPDICCPGSMEGQLLSELSSKPDFANNNNTLKSPSNNKAASSIHSIELSLPEDNRQPETISDDATLSKTEVDIYVTNNYDSDNSKMATTTSKRTKIKQSIRAFSSKKSFSTKFPSFRSISSNESKSSSSKRLYQGYGDPLLLARVRERMVV